MCLSIRWTLFELEGDGVVDIEDTETQYIDSHLYLDYAAVMTTTVRVIQSHDACCRSVIEPRVLEIDARDQLLAVFKALSDGTRLDVFQLIASKEEPICACDVVDRFDVSQPTIAHHLKVLRQAGLIAVSRQGVWAYYAVAPEGIDVLDQVLSMMGVQPPLVLEWAG